MRPYSEYLKAPTLMLWNRAEEQARGDWLIHPCGTNREADSAIRSNHRVAVADLEKADPEKTDHDVCEFGDPFVGWHKLIIVRPGTPCAVLAAEHESSLEDYPFLDDDDHSELEEEEAQEIWKHCYSTAGRIAYIRAHYTQFEHCNPKWYPAVEAWRNLLACARGQVFYGYASELCDQ